MRRRAWRRRWTRAARRSAPPWRWPAWREASSARRGSIPPGASRAIPSRPRSSPPLRARSASSFSGTARASSGWPSRPEVACSTRTARSVMPRGPGARSWTPRGSLARFAPTTTWEPVRIERRPGGIRTSRPCGPSSPLLTSIRWRACEPTRASCPQPWRRPAGPRDSRSFTLPGGSPRNWMDASSSRRPSAPRTFPGFATPPASSRRGEGSSATSGWWPSSWRSRPSSWRDPGRTLPRAPRCCSTGGPSGGRRSGRRGATR